MPTPGSARFLCVQAFHPITAKLPVRLSNPKAPRCSLQRGPAHAARTTERRTRNAAVRAFSGLRCDCPSLPHPWHGSSSWGCQFRSSADRNRQLIGIYSLRPWEFLHIWPLRRRLKPANVVVCTVPHVTFRQRRTLCAETYIAVLHIGLCFRRASAGFADRPLQRCMTTIARGGRHHIQETAPARRFGWAP
jgi:hypothetical protein